ncbi:phosphoenolpyruvate carboxylase [Pedobacter sp. P26]|uniref:phosphoenolpyruvate carboxylase n=1 Tax=Pedobacter sp. P26 TaxID=3423956 RepID=UPI003D67A740
MAFILKKNADNKPVLAKIEKLIDELSLRLVLTAHPTQFYPGSVLAIITDLTKAIRDNDITSMNSLLQQLGKTPFFNKKSPTPVDEALNLAWFLENTFYFAAANIQEEIDQNLDEYNLETKKILELGFWPGVTGMEIRISMPIPPWRFLKCCGRSFSAVTTVISG